MRFQEIQINREWNRLNIISYFSPIENASDHVLNINSNHLKMTTPINLFSMQPELTTRPNVFLLISAPLEKPLVQ